MSNDSMSAHEDLAFKPAWIGADGNASPRPRRGCKVKQMGGLIYGAQCLAEWAGLAGFVPTQAGVRTSGSGVRPTVLCVRSRGSHQPDGAQTANQDQHATGDERGLRLDGVCEPGDGRGVRPRRLSAPRLDHLGALRVRGVRVPVAAWLTSFALRKRAWHPADRALLVRHRDALDLILGSPEPAFSIRGRRYDPVSWRCPVFITLRAATRQQG